MALLIEKLGAPVSVVVPFTCRRLELLFATVSVDCPMVSVLIWEVLFTAWAKKGE